MPLPNSAVFDDFIGIPFREHGRGKLGCDCWGLLALVYREVLGVELPSYSDRYVTTQDAEELSRLIHGELGPWVGLLPGQEGVGDAMLMLEAGIERHVGVVVSPGYVLHVENGGFSVIESYRGPRLRRRIAGFFRHESLA